MIHSNLLHRQTNHTFTSVMRWPKLVRGIRVLTGDVGITGHSLHGEKVALLWFSVTPQTDVSRKRTFNSVILTELCRLEGHLHNNIWVKCVPVRVTFSGRSVQSCLSREITIQWGGAWGAGHTGGYTNSRFKYLHLLYSTTRGRNLKV